ncbi:MAG: radical SAM protein [Acidobacteria bacterium]|nr:radical SAM protein [Acidobacteriota bacterium]
MRRTEPGDLVAITSTDGSIGIDLDAWARFTGNSLVSATAQAGQWRWVIRHGRGPAREDDHRALGSRLWLYTNFDCNLKCDYCCVRSSPGTPRRELGLDRVRRIAREAPALGVSAFFLTGGEPFLLPDIDAVVQACAAAAPATVLTNGMLFRGPRLRALASMPRDRVTLQISLDSPTPELHDAHRGAGTWARAWEGIQIARREGFRVRLAATISSDEEEEAFRRFLDAHDIATEDRVIRRIALRGYATKGLALVRTDLLPEITITAEGVYWHPVGAEDADLLVTREMFPLAAAFDAVRRTAEEEQRFQARLASIFYCA